MESVGAESRGQRVRKKRVRLGEDSDSDVENQPPSSIPRVGKDSIFAKAEAALNYTPQPLFLGKTPLGSSNSPAVVLEDNDGPQDMEAEPEVAEHVQWERPADVGCPGQIKAVTLINFMCHEHLKMEFGPNVNFISGQNGSGKSAVLQALQQVLGVLARDTGRASQSKAFIKANCPEARITVKLWNEGPQAYLPHLFSKEIVIERRIGVRSSSLAVRKAKNELVGSTKKDLESVLDALAIDAANPISVMTQDTTRSFMDGGSGRRDREKYNIYMDATMLSRIADANAAADAQLNSMKAEVESEQEKHGKLAKELKDMEKRLDGLKEVESMSNEENSLQNALAWAIVASSKAQLEKLEQQSGADGPSAQQRAEEELAQAREELETLKCNIASQKTAFELHSKDMEELTGESRALRVELNDLKQASKQAKKTLQAKQKKHATSAAACKDMMETVEKEEEHLFKERQAANDKFDEQQNTLETERDKLAKELEDRISERADLIKTVQDMQRAYDVKREELRVCKLGVEFWAAEVARWKEFSADPLTKWGGSNVVQVQQLIQEFSEKFHKVPIGPIGDLLALTDPQWAQSIENAVGRTFNAFLVHDSHDCGVLKALCRSNGLHFPPCMVGPFDLPRHNVKRGLPPNHVLTIYHALSCTNPSFADAIINNLTDQVFIEKHALAMSEEELQAASKHSSVISAWLPNGSHVVKGRKSLTLVPPRADQMKPRIGANEAEILTEVKDNLEAAQAEQAELEDEMKVMWQDVERRRKKEKPILSQRVHEASDAKREVENKIHNLLSDRNMDAITASATDAHSSSLRADLEAAEHDLNDKAVALNAAETAAERAEAAEGSCKARLADIRARISALETANRQITDDQAMNDELLDAAHAKVTAREEFAAELAARLGKIVDITDSVRAKVEDHTEGASMVCSEEDGYAALESYKASLATKNVPEDQIGPNSMPEVIAKKLERLQKKIREQTELAGGARDVLERKFRQVSRKVRESKRSLDELMAAYLLLTDGMAWRTAQYKKMEKTVQETVNRKFNYYLNKKGHSGSIRVAAKKIKDSDVEIPFLEIKVLIDGSNDIGKVKDLKELSGGERSFTTVAFSLALGEFTGSPFRAMDEFDVFMDAINRQVSLESLLTNALEHKDLQFLFLTPLDISAVEGAKAKMRSKGIDIEDSFVKILKMRAAH